MKFSKATRKTAKARVALVGPSGSGKTMTALLVALGLVGKAGRIAVLDSERGSASKYAGEPDMPEFDSCELTSFSPLTYVEGITEAIKAGYDAVIVDSLSHAWMGRDGALEQVDRAAKRSRSGNNFAAWREVTPMHNTLVDALVQAPMHVIVTMRAKTEYVLDDDDRGKKVPRKLGLAPVQRDGLEYEFDVVADMDADNTLVVSKTRCRELSGAVIKKPTVELGQRLAAWLQQGEPAALASGEALARIRELLGSLPGAEGVILDRAHVARLEDLPADKAQLAIEWLGKQPPAPARAASAPPTPKEPSPLATLAATLEAATGAGPASPSSTAAAVAVAPEVDRSNGDGSRPVAVPA